MVRTIRNRNDEKDKYKKNKRNERMKSKIDKNKRIIMMRNVI